MDIADALDLFKQHIVAEKGLSPKTCESYMMDLDLFFQYFNFKKDTSELYGEDIIEYLRYASSQALDEESKNYIKSP